MKRKKLSEHFQSLLKSAARLASLESAEAVVVLAESNFSFKVMKKLLPGVRLLVAADDPVIQESVRADEIDLIPLEHEPQSPAHQVAQVLLEAIADDLLQSGDTVVVVYSAFEKDACDTVSIIKLAEQLAKLTSRDLQKLETQVPLETLRVVVDLACEIGREGREGKSVGTLFVVGDHRKVLEESRPAGFDMVKGYSRKERNIADSKVREGIKELAQLDGCFVISSDGTIEGSARIIDTSPVEITMSKGLGSRHFAGAAISKNTKAIAVVVSETNGTVRIFQNGEVVLRIEPLQRAMKFKGLEQERTFDETTRE